MNRRSLFKSIIGAAIAPEIPVPKVEEIRGLGYRIYPNVVVKEHLIQHGNRIGKSLDPLLEYLFLNPHAHPSSTSLDV